MIEAEFRDVPEGEGHTQGLDGSRDGASASEAATSAEGGTFDGIDLKAEAQAAAQAAAQATADAEANAARWREALGMPLSGFFHGPDGRPLPQGDGMDAAIFRRLSSVRTSAGSVAMHSSVLWRCRSGSSEWVHVLLEGRVFHRKGSCATTRQGVPPHQKAHQIQVVHLFILLIGHLCEEEEMHYTWVVVPVFSSLHLLPADFCLLASSWCALPRNDRGALTRSCGGTRKRGRNF